MKIILLQDVPKIGKKYEIKEINSGYALNFLIPKKLAELATPQKIKDISKLKNNITIEKNIQESLLMKNLTELKNIEIIFTEKTNDQGHLFAGIGKKEIIEKLKNDKKIILEEEFLELEKPFKEVGEFEVIVKVKGKQSSLKIIIAKEN